MVFLIDIISKIFKFESEIWNIFVYVEFIIV